jgi:type VI secretion system protein ImpE
MSVKELFESGELSEAIQAAISQVKQKPTDVSGRYRLAILLCYNGELEKADRQLQTLSSQQPEAAVGTALLRQLIRADLCRREFQTAGRIPEFAGEPDELLKLHLKASVCLREGQRSEAAELLAEAEERRPGISGTCDDQTFEDLRDLDDLLAPLLEVLTSTGKYFWLPLSDVQAVEMQEPESLADLLWRPARITLSNELPGAVYLPTLYVGSAEDPREAVRLGRATEWLGLEDPPVQGRGLRMMLVGDEARSILEIGKLDLTHGPPGKPQAIRGESHPS